MSINSPDRGTVEIAVKTIQLLEQDREMAWKNVHIIERAIQEQDKKLKELESKYAQCQQDYREVSRQLASAEALIETLQEQLK